MMRVANRQEPVVRKKSAAREWIESIVIAFILAMFIRTFFIQAFKIPTGSMIPTLLVGDKILVNKFIYGIKIPFTDLRILEIRDPKRGDVIVFKYPEEPKKDFIKRLVALEGEKLLISEGKIYVNGKALENSLFGQRYYYNRGEYSGGLKEVVIPKDSFYVLGDNSASSRDSRYWGFVPEKNLVGKAFLIWWPPKRIRIIK